MTMRPRNFDGPSSEMYNGTTRLAAPTARPTILLPSIMVQTLAAKDCSNAPIINRASAITIIHLRPSLSARMPASGLARRAKKLVQEVIRLLSRVVRERWERSKPMETKVDEITPVLFVH